MQNYYLLGYLIAFFTTLITVSGAIYTGIMTSRADKKISEMKNKQSKNNLMNDHQIALIGIIPKIVGNYFKTTNMNEKVRMALLEERIYHKEDIDNSINELIFLNIQIIKATNSKQVLTLISNNMQKNYTNTLDKHDSLVYYSLLYKYLVLDFKEMEIDDLFLLRIYITDFKNNQHDFEKSAKKMKNEISKVL